MPPNASAAALAIASVAARAQIRQDGFAEGPSGEGSFLSIAAALPTNSLGVPLVLGVAGPVERMRDKLPVLGALLRASVEHLAAAT